jgi:hypothetical protein
LLAGKTGRNLIRYSAAWVLGLALISTSVRGADPDPVAADRVGILDAGTFLRVEAHNATLTEVLDRLKPRLKIRVTNSELLDLSRRVNGSKTGTALEVVQWMAPGASFILIYDGPKPGETKPRKLERIGFLSSGTAVPSTGAAAPSAPAPESPTSAASTTTSVGLPKPQRGAAVPTNTASPSPDEKLKPGVPPSTPKSEIMGVADQLRALTPETQLAIEQQARSPDPQTPSPGFLQPNQDAAQTTLQQQQERSQPLAVEQLRTLMEAYAAVSRARASGASAAQR